MLVTTEGNQTTGNLQHIFSEAENYLNKIFTNKNTNPLFCSYKKQRSSST